MTAAEADARRVEEARRYAADRFGEHLQRRSIVIIYLCGTQVTENGTGTCIKVGARFFVATAGHIIRDRGPAQLALVFARYPRHSQLPVHRFGYRGGAVGDLDVGWIELSPEEAAQTGQVFVSVDRLLPYCRHLDNGLTYTFGCPSGLATAVQEGETLHLRMAAITHVSGTLEPESWPADGNPDVDIYLRYSKEGHTRTSGAPLDYIHPGGMSGGGTWINPTPDNAIWSPDPARLIGIEKSAWPENEFLRGTQIQHWMQMIAEGFPELQPALWPANG